jgi:hypothetical protein
MCSLLDQRLCVNLRTLFGFRPLCSCVLTSSEEQPQRHTPMGCGSSSDLQAHPGFAEVLAIQAQTRQSFTQSAQLISALDFIMSRHHEDSKAGESHELEVLVARVANDNRILAKMDGAPVDMPEGSIKSNLDLLEAAIVRKVRPKVKPAIVKSTSSKHKMEEREKAADNAMASAVHVCLIQEVLEHFAPKHYHQQQQQSTRDAAGSHEGPAREYRVEDSTHNRVEGGESPHADQAPVSHTPKNRTSGRNSPTAAASASPLVPPPHDASAAEADLRYPLPEGSWMVSDENPDFYWNDDLKLYYYPAAGHFMDPDSGMWYVAQEDQWLSPEDHEALLQQMAARGEY